MEFEDKAEQSGWKLFTLDEIAVVLRYGGC
jgi:hypothetical protein